MTTLKSANRALHRRVGLALFVPLAWFALTGGALGALQLGKSFAQRDHATAQTAAPTAEAELRALLEMPEVRPRHREIRSVRFSESSASRRAARVEFTGGESWPAGPDEAGAFEPLRKSITRLHRGKFAGTAGRAVATGFGLLLFLLTLSGLAMLRPRRHSRLKSGSRRNHHRLSLLAGIPLLVVLLSGAIWNFSEELRDQKRESPALVKDLPDALARARALYPGREPSGIYQINGKTLVLFNDAGRVYLTPNSAEVFDPASFRGILELCYLLHTGALWGPAGTWLSLVLALMVLAMVWSGGRLAIG